DGKKLYSSGYDRTLREWDAAEGKELRKLSTDPRQTFYFNSLVVHPREPLLLTLDTTAVREWDLKEGKETRKVAIERTSYATLCPDGKHFAAFKDNAVILRDLDDKEV